MKTDGQLIQTPPPYDEYITEIREQWIPTPVVEQATAFQDLWQDFQVSHIPLTFANVSHTPTQLKEPLHITLSTHISKENNNTSRTQTVQPTLGFIYTSRDTPCTKQPNINCSTTAQN